MDRTRDHPQRPLQLQATAARGLDSALPLNPLQQPPGLRGNRRPQRGFGLKAQQRGPKPAVDICLLPIDQFAEEGIRVLP